MKDKFETIQCSRLEVLDSDGNVRLVLNGGRADSDNTPPQDVVEILRKDGSTIAKVQVWEDSVFVKIPGGSINAQGFTASGPFGEASLSPGKVEVRKPVPYINPMEYKSKKIEAEYRGEQPPDTSTVEQAVYLSCNEYGGKVSVYGKGAGDMYRGGSFLMSGGRNGKDTQDAVEIDFDQETKHGRVKVAQKYPVSWIDEKKGYQEGQHETGVGLGINEYGGVVKAIGKGKDIKSQVLLGIGASGGQVYVGGKDIKSRVCLAIVESGGLVSTADKYGNMKVLD